MEDIKVILRSFSLTDASKNIFGYSNNSTSERVVKILHDNGYDPSIFEGRNKLEKYPIVKKICPVCGSEFITRKGKKKEKTTCSIKCSNTYNPKRKKSNIPKYKRNPVEIECNECGEFFSVGSMKRNQKYCSISCASKAKWKIPGYRDNLRKINSKIAKKRHMDPNDNFGWSTRKKLTPSYPESIAIRELDRLGVNYEWELPFKGYFIDFALEDKMIVIEIDGQQHNKPERKITDNKKDLLLLSEGWKVYRIKWPDDNIIESINDIIEESYGKE